MNTADRSIAFLDTALRRRFEFMELMPDSDLVPENVGGIALRKLFVKINERIEHSFGREFQIGHAFFMDCETRDAVEGVFRNRVIPLLSEYFYDDRSKLVRILENKFTTESINDSTKNSDNDSAGNEEGNGAESAGDNTEGNADKDAGENSSSATKNYSGCFFDVEQLRPEYPSGLRKLEFMNSGSDSKTRWRILVKNKFDFSKLA